jgi:hypothetical protein
LRRLLTSIILKEVCPDAFQGRMTLSNAWMRLPEERWPPGWNPGDPGFQDGVSGRKMALQIAGWASGKPGWQPGKKDDGPGS